MKINKKEVRFISFRFALLLMVAGFVWFESRPNVGIVPVTKEFSTHKLDVERQVLWLRVDSLSTLLSKLPKDKIIWKDEGSRLRFTAIDIDEFNRILLDNSYLSAYQSLENPIITMTKNGFWATIETKNKIRYVQLPAEIISSLQINTNF